MKVRFIPLDGPGTRGPAVITRFPVILTRSSRNGPPAADVVSPLHCEIDCRNGLLVVRNLNSRHGTFVNEVRVQRSYLFPGDKLTVGLASFEVRYNQPRSRINGSRRARTAAP
jgi:pSer/pThr/pTyr-binding forkhead associated (FHA) protein